MSLSPIDSGQFVQLQFGECHYRIEGPSEAPLLVMIHGATVPLWEFDRIVPLLHAAGIGTARLDLYGHGLSARPHQTYSLTLFADQVCQWLNHLGLDRPFTMLGHSLGAAVAAEVCRRQPEAVEKLILAAPLVDFIQNAPVLQWLGQPIIGRWLTELLALPLLKHRRQQRYRMLEGGRFIPLFEQQIAKPGFGRALHGLFTAGTLTNQLETYAAIADHPRQVLLIRGTEDPIVTDRQLVMLSQQLPNAHYQRVPNTSHAFLLNHPDIASRHITTFVHRNAG